LSIEHDPDFGLPDIALVEFVANQRILFLRGETGRMRAHRDAFLGLQVEREPDPDQHQHFQQQEIAQPRRNQQKKQKAKYYNNNKNNNRVDRQKHVQTNMRVHQPQQRGRKK